MADKDRSDLLGMKDQEIIDLVKADYATAEDKRRDPTKRNRRYRKIYFQKEDVPSVSQKDQPQAKTAKRARNYLPIGRAFVDTASAMICDSMFSQDPFLLMEPRETEDQEHSAEFQNLFRFRAGRSQMNLRTKFEDQFIFQACLYDFVVGRVGWKIAPGYIPHLEEKTVLTKMGLFRWPRKVKEIKMVKKFDAVDRPEFEVLNTLMCYPDPVATDFDDSRYFIYLQETNRADMKRLEKTKENPYGIYENVKKIEPNSYPGLKAEQQTQGKDEYEKKSESDLVLLINYYTPDAMVQIANWKWVVRKKRITGYPFTKGAYCQPDHQWSGIGLLEAAEQLQIDINQLIRLRRDNINNIVNAITIINKALFGLMPKDKDWRMWSGRTFQISQGDPSKAIHFERPPDTTQTILQDVNFDLHILERTVGISENALAVYRTGRRTATEAGLVAQGTETRMGNIASKFENRNLVDIAMMDYNLELQNLTDPARYRILGPKGYEFRSTDREGILHKGSFDVKPIGTLMFGNKQMKDNKFLQTASLVVGNPMMAQSSDLTAILRELWTRAEVKDPDRFIRDISATDYVIPPEMENEMILGIGQHLKPGNNDNDEEHIRSHTDFMERGDYPKEYKPVFEEHISLHEQRVAQMKSGGGANIPTAPENVLGQQFQNFGGLRVPGEGSPEGMTPGPGELALGGGAGAQGQG